MLNSPVEEIKQRLDIVDVLGEYLQLKRAGGNFRAVCPFHHEKTPSFMVSKEKQIWHCFGCGKGGDIFSFIQEIEGMEFPEALRVLAKRANVDLVRQDPALVNKKTRMLDALKYSAEWFMKQLTLNTEAKNYFANRKVTEETKENFQLGYAPETWDGLNKYLLGRGFTEDEIFQAGMSIKKEKGVGYYDRFRGRVIFPIKDIHGSIVGFTGRLLKEDPEKRMGKYVNTPQTMAYDKSQVIYGLNMAKQEIKRLGAAIMVEGNMDVVTCHQAGFRNVVASSGTALTERQVQLLKRYSPNLIISFDMDSAGKEAAKRGIEVALQLEMNIKVLSLPKEFKDPDEAIKKDPQIFKEAIRNAQSIMDYYFQSALSGADPKQVAGKKKIAIELLPIIAKIGDTIERTHYLQKLGEIINVPEEVLRDRILKTKKPIKKEDKQEEVSIDAPKDRFAQLSERLLALAVKNTDDFKYFVDYLDPEYLSPLYLQNLYKKMIEFYNQYGKINLNEFVALNLDLKKHIDLLSLLFEKDFYGLSPSELQAEVISSLKTLERNYVKRRIKQLEKEIKKAEQEKNTEAADKLLNEINLLTQKLTQIS
ncbi:MAG: DNA primase [Patescibacteria group bacterium]|jgi:DNA primase